MLNSIYLAQRQIHTFIRFFFCPFIVLFSLIFCVSAIPFVGMPHPFNFNLLLIFSLGNALIFSLPFFLIKLTSFSLTEKNCYNRDRAMRLRKYLVVPIMVFFGFSAFIIESVTSQVSNLTKLTGFHIASAFTVGLYLSVISISFIVIFAVLFYYSR